MHAATYHMRPASTVKRSTCRRAATWRPASTQAAKRERPALRVSSGHTPCALYRFAKPICPRSARGDAPRLAGVSGSESPGRGLFLFPRNENQMTETQTADVEALIDNWTVLEPIVTEVVRRTRLTRTEAMILWLITSQENDDAEPEPGQTT